jgi:TorA maturation chaperone TorD
MNAPMSFSHETSDRADFFLMLSRAFRTPIDGEFFRAMQDFLADDIEAASRELGLSLEGGLNELRQALSALSGHEELLQAYSRLFLSPPVEAPLNVGIYLDGGLMGGTVTAIEKYYARHGLAKNEGFRDLPDHLAVVLEFQAMLLTLAAEATETDPARSDQLLAESQELQSDFLASWLPRLADMAEDATAKHSLNPTYALLCRILSDSVVAWTETAEGKNNDGKRKGQARLDVPCALCGTPFINAPALRRLTLTLEAAGASTEHLDVCPACRDESMGFVKKSMPGLGRR